MIRSIEITILLILIAFSCKVPSHISQEASPTLTNKSIDLKLVYRGVTVDESRIQIFYQEAAFYIRDSLVLKPCYDIVYKNLIFRLQEIHLGHSNWVKIQYDDRLFKNKVKKGRRKMSIFFVRKHFILDTGLDDIWLIPIRMVEQGKN